MTGTYGIEAHGGPLFFALKGRDNAAQGLGPGWPDVVPTTPALKGRDKAIAACLCRPFRAG